MNEYDRTSLLERQLAQDDELKHRLRLAGVDPLTMSFEERQRRVLEIAGAQALGEPERSAAPLPELVPVADFIAIEEAGAEPLVGSAGAALIPTGGDVMLYGAGGAGKTSLALDLACHLAAGDDWLGLPVPRASVVALVENEGPRPLFRDKLRRKHAAWSGSPIGDRLHVLERPWGEFSFAEAAWRESLAAAIRFLAVDVLIVGPVTRAGMDAAGTLQEVRDFMALVEQLRRASDRRLTVILVHHENKGGQVSGAWEGAGDTLCHVQGQGHGRTRLFFQKARWASDQHGTALNLLWADGEGFTVEEKAELDDEAIAELIIEQVRENAGTGWMKVERSIKTIGNERIRAVRDRLLEAGLIVNVEGGELRPLQERRAAHLYVAEDPSIRHLRQDSGAALAQPAPAWAAGDDATALPPLRPYGAGGVGAAHPPPSEELEWR